MRLRSGRTTRQRDAPPSLKRRYIVVKKEFKDGAPHVTDFELTEQPLPDLKNNQFLLKVEYISVDPYQQSFALELPTPYEQFAFVVGKVTVSKHPKYPVGKVLVAHATWSDYVVLDGKPDEFFNMEPYSPPVDTLPLSLAVGALGMPGMTALLGLTEVCKIKENEIVCVTSAAGAVGSLVGQIAKINGCNVIGFAGTDDKVRFLKEKLKFDHAFNYKTESNTKVLLGKVAPKGVDVFFDNVGGALSNAILECMSVRGRVAYCGAISQYAGAVDKAPSGRAGVAVKVESFSFTQWPFEKQLAAVQQIQLWIKEKRIVAKETVIKDLEKLPEALVGMLRGDHIGKVVVKV